MATTKWVPFVIYVRVDPRRGKRWEYLRDLQKLSVLVYNELSSLNGFQFAQPGGGAAAQFGAIDHRGGLGDFAPGTGVKPQIGQSPAQLMITGFYQSSAQNTQSYSEVLRISGGTKYTGFAAHSNDAVPVAAVNDEVKTLKTAVTDAITTALPEGTPFSIFRLVYAGIVFGDKGFHFPK
jgi:hypothetical protein